MESWLQIDMGDGSTEEWAHHINVRVGCLDAAQLYAAQAGFYDLDVDTDERGVRIVASAHKRTLTARGKNMSEACQRLVEAINGNG